MPETKHDRYLIATAFFAATALLAFIYGFVWPGSLPGPLTETTRPDLSLEREAVPSETSNTGLGITSPLALTRAGNRDDQVTPTGTGPARYVETRSHRAVTIGFDALNHSVATLDARAYTLHSPSDPNYAASVPAVRVGSDQQAVGFDTEKRVLIDARLHLLFPLPLKPGHDYTLDISAAFPGTERLTIPVHYMSDGVSGSIQVNQVGYSIDAPKFAFLGNWLGSAGPMPVDSPEFEVVDTASGETVLKGEAKLRAAADPWSGNDVWQIDISALTHPGRYRLSVNGLGVSDPFSIADNPYDPLYRSLMRLFYHSRNSQAITVPWADPGFERPKGGVPAVLDGVFHAAVGDSPLGRGETAGEHHQVTGGWFDAGDFGQYVPNAAPIWFQIGAAFDIAPDRFLDGDLHIPKSDNDVPDVLDELEWGMNWMLSMQDPTDGGVYFRIASRNWDESPPHKVAVPRLIAEKTTHATASFAAACAIHARLIAPYRAERASRVLAAAVKAWDFLQSHPTWPAEGDRYRNPPGVHAGEYADTSALDNTLWAAAELYRSTGQKPFLEAYEKLAPRVRTDPTQGVNYKELGMAAFWAYLMSPDEQKDPVLKTSARDQLIAAADWYIRKAEEHPYRAPVHQYIGFLGWGSFARSTRAVLPLMQAHLLTGNLKYLEWARQMSNPQLGANPQSLSYVTGTGIRSPLHPLSKLSKFATVETPMHGIPVHGPHFHLPELWREMSTVNNAYYPRAKSRPEKHGRDVDFTTLYPALRRYTDAEHLPPMSEPTVAEYAETAIAYALLR